MLIGGEADKEVTDQIAAIFDDFMSAIPGVKEALPNYKLVITCEPDATD